MPFVVGSMCFLLTWSDYVRERQKRKYRIEVTGVDPEELYVKAKRLDNEIDTKEVVSEHFKIEERSSGTLDVVSKEYKLMLRPLSVVLNYTEHRPYHDHNDVHSIVVKIPDCGVIDPLPVSSLNRVLEFQPCVLDLSDTWNANIIIKEYGSVRKISIEQLRLILEDNKYLVPKEP